MGNASKENLSQRMLSKDSWAGSKQMRKVSKELQYRSNTMIQIKKNVKKTRVSKNGGETLWPNICIIGRGKKEEEN